MKLYYEILKLLINKYIKRYETGIAIKIFCENMGLAYIKLAQILSTQNYGDIFTQKDRILLSSICDECNPIQFKDIENILINEYKTELYNIFSEIDKSPLGSASISQVHKAILKNGDIVAIKVKRKDITDSVEKDIKTMKKIFHRFGKFVKFQNIVGGEKALDLYLKWIYEETDFQNEKENIKIYQKFANNVNGKIDNTKDIKVPKVYEKLCTDNIIVMEYIDSKTINKMELNEENNKKIAIGINSYIQSSFYALLNNKQIVFHGDPHRWKYLYR